MKKIKVLFAIICLTLMATMTPLVSHADITVEIDVAPNVINLGSSSKCVTVHTNITSSLVDVDTVVLSVEKSEGIENYECFADERGNLVAKFHMTEIKDELSDAGMCIFELSGLTTGGSYFYGAQMIKVFDNSEQSGGKM